jgi:subtilisin
MHHSHHKKITIASLALSAILLGLLGYTSSLLLGSGGVDKLTVAPTPHLLEGKTSVSVEEFASRVDYARKIVVLNDATKEDEFKGQVASLGGEIIKQSDGDTYIIQLPKDKVAQQEKVLANSESVATVETDYPIAITGRADWGVERIRADRVWESTAGQNVKIAILDTGIDSAHSDLAGVVAAGYNFVDNNSDYTDGHGHGTHVAGIAAALKNGIGYIGVSHQARLIVGKVLGDDGIGYVSDVVEGIKWSRSQGAQVINLSLGSTHKSKVLEDVISKAVNAGVIVVAAAGNNNGGALLYPAAYGSVISVGASDSKDNLASFSAIGATLVAPGVGITSTLPNNAYGRWSGTSMAAPHVSAAAALLLARGESDVRNALFTTASVVSAGHLPNLETALSGEDVLAPLTTITSPTHRATLSGTVKFTATATDESGIKEVVFRLGDRILTTFTTEPYEHELDTTKLPDGNYDFSVTATDQSGNVALVKIAVTIKNSESTGSLESTLPRQDSDNVSQENRRDTEADNPSQSVRQDNEFTLPSEITNWGQRFLPRPNRGR